MTAQSRHSAEMEALCSGKFGGCAWNLQRGLSLNNADLATTAESTSWQQERTTLSPQYGTIPQGEQPATCWIVHSTLEGPVIHLG